MAVKIMNSQNAFALM